MYMRLHIHICIPFEVLVGFGDRTNFMHVFNSYVVNRNKVKNMYKRSTQKKKYYFFFNSKQIPNQ